MVLEKKRILLGVSGSIAAYKTVSLASALTKAGAVVDVILTEDAAKLVAPLTFSSVTGRRAYLDRDLWESSDHVLHIDLGENIQAMLIAPATANTIAKLANGLADNLLSLTALASRAGVLIAPAMDGGMFQNPATQANLQTLQGRGIEIWGPAEGHLASGLSGAGRMLEPGELLGRLCTWLGRSGPLAGKKVVVTAGGTQEPIDPVRVISNRSSGKQGFALARAALYQGANVALISGPTCLHPPEGAAHIQAGTAWEMLDAVLAEVQDADALIMAAAVADYRPVRAAVQKMKKNRSGLEVIELEPTADILLEVARSRQEGGGPEVVVGFAAETEDLVKNAAAKLEGKNLDLIAANDVSGKDAGIGSDLNQITLLWPGGKKRELPLQSKADAASEIIQEVIRLFREEDSL